MPTLLTTAMCSTPPRAMSAPPPRLSGRASFGVPTCTFNAATGSSVQLLRGAPVLSCRISQRLKGTAGRTEVSPTTTCEFDVPTKMNTTPHARETRKLFYDDVSQSILKALATDGTRFSVKMVIPETNPEMDVFRIGTMLEMIRDVATAAAADGKKVKVCVQGTMGEGVFQGLPLSLSGVRRILDAMDWGDADSFVTKGEVGAEEVDEADYYVIISPQNIVGHSVVPRLEAMVEAAEAKGKKVVIVNPNLGDIMSSGGVMGVRGREGRMDFAKSFEKAYEFRLLYVSGSWYPIMGALRFAWNEGWSVFKRTGMGKNEAYVPHMKWETEPTRSDISDSLMNRR